MQKHSRPAQLALVSSPLIRSSLKLDFREQVRLVSTFHTLRIQPWNAWLSTEGLECVNIRAVQGLTEMGSVRAGIANEKRTSRNIETTRAFGVRE